MPRYASEVVTESGVRSSKSHSHGSPVMARESQWSNLPRLPCDHHFNSELIEDFSPPDPLGPKGLMYTPGGDEVGRSLLSRWTAFEFFDPVVVVFHLRVDRFDRRGVGPHPGLHW